MSRQAVLGELPVNDNSDPTSKARRLNFSCETPDKVAAHLKLEDALGGVPIRIPLTQKMTPVRNESIPEEWATILTPARFCRKLNIDVQPHHPNDAKPKKFTRLNNDNWIYIYVNGCLWRELQIERHRSATYYKDVNLENYEEHKNQDRRIASGQRVNRVVLPIKLENKEVTVEVAYSDIQWSWARVQSMGGIAPQGVKRKDWFPDEHPVNSKGKALRNDRMQTLPLLKGYANAFSQTVGDVMPIEECNLYEFRLDDGKKFPFIALNNYLEDAKDLAFSYQQSWRDLEGYIAELSDPKNVKIHEYAPWFQSAVLTNQYFFAEHPDIESENVEQNTGKPSDKKKEWKKAKQQRDEWKSKLSLPDIQKALGTEKRKEIRDNIKKTKIKLVDFLAKDSPYIKELTSTIDDYCTLPNEIECTKNQEHAHSGMRYKLGDELFSRLGDHEITIDYHLETKPITQSEYYAQRGNDEGYKFLGEIAIGGHPFSARFIPPKFSEIAKVTTQNLNDDDPLITVTKLARIGRRSAHFVSSFIGHFESVAVSKKFASAQENLALLYSKTGLGINNLERINVTLEEYLTGELKGENAKNYEILRVEVREADKIIKGRIEKVLAEEEVNKAVKLAGDLEVFDPKGGLVGSTNLDAFHNGKGFSRKYIRRKGKKTNWHRYKLSIWVNRKVQGVEGFAKGLVDNGVWAKGILPAVAIFEAWNLQTYFNKWNKSEKLFNKELVDLSSAIVDMAAVIAVIHEHRLRYSHHQGLQITGRKKDLPIALNKAMKYARTLGAAASAYSMVLSLVNMIQNTYEGDDAAIAHGVMALGFSIALASEVIAGLAAFKIISLTGSATLVFAAGPLAWIALAIILVGAALLIWVFTEDTELEQWLANNPFSIQSAKQFQSQGYGAYQGNGYYQAHNARFLMSDQGTLIHISPLLGNRVRQDAEGNVYATENGVERQIAKMREPIDPDKLADRSQRFAGVSDDDTITDKFGLWRIHPEACYDAIIDAIYRPTASMKIFDHGKEYAPDYEVDLVIHIPNYIENKTRVRVVLEQRKTVFDKYKKIFKTFRLVTPEGSGPRTVHIKHKLDKSMSSVKAEVYLDLYGNGVVTLPLGKQTWTEEQEAGRQRIRTEQNIRPVGRVNVAGQTPESGVAIPEYVKPAVAPIVVKASPPMAKRGRFDLD